MKPSNRWLRVIRLATVALVAAAASASAPAWASPYPIQLGNDPRLVTYSYDQHEIFVIVARPMAITHVQLNDDEEIVSFALGDTVQWLVDQAQNNLFLKPIRAGLATSGTLVTNKRVYQLSLQSVPESGKWYQRVTWSYPDLLIRNKVQTMTGVRGGNVLRTREAPRGGVGLGDGAEFFPNASASKAMVTPHVSIENLNFEYDIEGTASFKPVQVFDDGRHTWLRMPKTALEAPALFVVPQDGDAQLANFVIKGEYIVIQQLFPKALLKIGKQEVAVINRKIKGGRAMCLFCND